MKINSENITDKQLLKPRREFLAKSGALLTGAVAASFGLPEMLSENNRKDLLQLQSDSYEIFDCHLHSPADKGEAWQWYKVTDPSTVIARIKSSFLTMDQKQKIFAGNLEALLKKVDVA